jgi:hypothetical protein
MITTKVRYRKEQEEKKKERTNAFRMFIDPFYHLIDR